MRIILNKEVKVAEEPTSSLDASVQAKIIKLLNNIQEELKHTFYHHNIALTRKISDRIAVMRSEKIVEEDSSSRILASPSHPYTKALFKTTPTLSSNSSLNTWELEKEFFYLSDDSHKLYCAQLIQG